MRLYIAHTEDKGRGVFTSVEFNRGDVIELCPVIIISEKDRTILDQSKMYDYYFVWGENDKEAAIALGYGSLYNHSQKPNAQFINDPQNEMIIIEAIAKIQPGEEIVIKYIDQNSKEKIWFQNKED